MENSDDIRLEGNVGVWDINAQGEINGLYLGTFRFKAFLTPMQKISADREYRDLLGAQITTANENESFLAYALTQLKYRIISAPPFWTSASTNGINGDLPDENVLALVLNAAVATEVKYRAQLKEKQLEAINRAKEAAEKAMKPSDDLLE